MSVAGAEAPIVAVGSAAIHVAGVTKVFGSNTALSEVSFDVARSEVVGLLGPNGAGKTTTLRVLLGMLRPTRGSATVLGLDCGREAVLVKRRVGYSPDEPSFFNALTGRETLDFAIRVRGMAVDATWGRLDPLIGLLDFRLQCDQVVASFSHGMKKKLALLLALLHDPEVLLLDEPTNGLDPSSAAAIRDLLLERARGGVAVLLSTHLLDMADRMCTRAVVLHRGKVLADGTPNELRSRVGLEEGASLEAAFLRLIA